METINRQTASARPTRSQIESLTCVVQRLWATQPAGDPDQRESLSVQLTRLEADLDRLHIRAAISELRPEDVGELRNCAERLAQLQRRWHPERALLPDGASP